MKFNYLFVDHHNGHETTFHAFSSNTFITQERTTELLSTIPGAYRSGTNINELLEMLDSIGIEFELVTCPCCEKKVQTLIHPDLELWERMAGIKWILLEGITGNY